MSCTVICRSISKSSELWLRRQLRSHDFFTEVFTMDQIIDPIDGLSKIKSLSYNNSLLLKILAKSRVIDAENIADWYKQKQLRKIPLSRPIVIHYLDFALNFSDFIKTSGHKVFVYCHGYDITWDLRSIEKPKEKYFPGNYIDRVLEMSKYVSFITNSKSSIQKLHSIGIPESNIHLNYFGLKPSSDIRVLNNNRPLNILYLGRLVDFKGPDLVLKAFEIACDNGFNGNLKIAGDGPLRSCLELLRQRSKYISRIEILGAVNESVACQLMNEADIFAAHNIMGDLSGQEEAFGVSIIEAMNHGLVVITAKQGGVIDSVNDGYNGFLVQPFDIGAHADAFLSLQQDVSLYNSLSRNACQTIKDKFSSELEYHRLKEILFGIKAQ